MPIREALIRLENEGLVTSHAGGVLSVRGMLEAERIGLPTIRSRPNGWASYAPF
jgi:DNA-binding GntR family transcriptional regulator